ncbi:hypothetical protein [Acinetobacter lwoffii]|uniref:hypothetical protein n=1 Tax=Acinetobacter lwoffii TaxID=28090 RepID=UPI001E41A361|nr:hypothetical protein [Acinetobacter lwoffii]
MKSIEQFEHHLKGNLYKLWNRLCSGSYFPPPVKGVPIPKKSGGVRMLGHSNSSGSSSTNSCQAYIGATD